MISTAYLLIAHGSRDPRSQAALNRLAQLVRDRLNPEPIAPWDGQLLIEKQLQSAMAMAKVDGQTNTETVLTVPKLVKTAAISLNRQVHNRVIVGTAVLDFGPFPLHQQIYKFGRRLSSAGIQQLKLVPLFLLRGKHVMEDIPEELAQAQELLGDTIQLDVQPHIGGHPGMLDLIKQRLTTTPKQGRLMVAHGSRRPKGNRTVDQLARTLGTAVAYWTGASDIEHQTIQLMQRGCSNLTIFPYFLFAGGITDAVAQMMEELAERFPRTNFRLLPPLGATSDLANLVVAACETDAVESSGLGAEPVAASRNPLPM